MNDYGILDRGVSVFCNDLGNGPSHSYTNVPFILAGSANGFLKTGQFIDFGQVYHNKLLNTIINAVGLRHEDGTYIDNFGDDSLPTGILSDLIQS